MARRRLKLIFGPSLVKEPVIYQLGRKFAIVTNIRRADVTRDQGWALLGVSGEPDEREKGAEYPASRGVKAERAAGDLVEPLRPQRRAIARRAPGSGLGAAA